MTPPIEYDLPDESQTIEITDDEPEPIKAELDEYLNELMDEVFLED